MAKWRMAYVAAASSMARIRTWRKSGRHLADTYEWKYADPVRVTYSVEDSRWLIWVRMR
jgi:hypothetical protein